MIARRLATSRRAPPVRARTAGLEAAARANRTARLVHRDRPAVGGPASRARRGRAPLPACGVSMACWWRSVGGYGVRLSVRRGPAHASFLLANCLAADRHLDRAVVCHRSRCILLAGSAPRSSSWWVLFPPLVHAIWNGNPQTLMLALLVTGTALAGALAAIVKLYALLPLAFHPRRLFRSRRPAGYASTLAVGALPRARTWSRFPPQRRHGMAARGASPFWSRRRCWRSGCCGSRAASGFQLPAVFPATQFYYVSTALPALVGRPCSRQRSRFPFRCWYRSSCYWLRSRRLSLANPLLRPDQHRCPRSAPQSAESIL